jgi:porphobilinogen synthase
MADKKPANQSHRFRRLRGNHHIRELTQENRLTTSDLIWPIFVIEGQDEAQDIISMPGVQRLTIDRAVLAAKRASNLGIPAICIFPYIDNKFKTEDCSEAWDLNNLSNRAISAIKSAVPEILIMTDVALDPYNINGHDGIVRNGIILNDETVDALVKMASSQAINGADILGPSDMMDGRVRAIRSELESSGFKDVMILSYSAKYASSFYGPFRDAVGASTLLVGDKKTYQMNPGNSDEALRLVARDLSEGADMVMIKPGMPYLDICRRVKDEFKVPTFAYQVSGEYSMLMAAIDNGWLKRDTTIHESLLSFKRAGCDGILTYFAIEIAEILNDQ